jgi:hypothetical protein
VPLAVSEEMNLVVMAVRWVMVVRFVADTAGFSAHFAFSCYGNVYS